jgi:hypothetical protein
MNRLVCWNCGACLDDVPLPISRHATCERCANQLHCCRLCQHYDPKRTLQCFEDRADPPLEKGNANFCEFFIPQAGAFNERSDGRQHAARQALDSMFAEPTPDASSTDAEPRAISPSESDQSAESAARRKLDNLFD